MRESTPPPFAVLLLKGLCLLLLRILCGVLEQTCRSIGALGLWLGSKWSWGWFRLADFFAKGARQ